MRIIRKGYRKEKKASCENCKALIGFYSCDTKYKNEPDPDGFHFHVIQYIDCPCCGECIKIQSAKI